MASVKENIRKGKVISYRFAVCMGRDADGKQIMKTMTWHPLRDLTSAIRTTAGRIAFEILLLSFTYDFPRYII